MMLTAAEHIKFLAASVFSFSMDEEFNHGSQSSGKIPTPPTPPFSLITCI